MNALARWLRFNISYFGQPPWDTQVTPPELIDFVAHHPAGSVLDLGCGTGTNLVYLAHFGWQVSGVDFALKAVESARERLRKAGLKGNLLVGDVTRLESLPGPFDLILDIGCFHSIDNSGRERYRANLQRLMAKGASFLIYAHMKASPDSQWGLDEKDMDALSAEMKQAWRIDSQDRGGRRAVWMEFSR